MTRRALSAFLLAILLGLGHPEAALGAAPAGADATARAPTARGWAVLLTARDVPAEDWLWPVPGPRRVLVPFRAPTHVYGPGHRGIDIAAAVGAEVRSPAAGTVAFRGVVVDRALLTVDHGGGLVTTFEPLESPLASGDRVSAGDPLGTVAVGGHAPPGTLHVGVRLDGEYINPLLLFGGVPRAVLLPCC